MIVEYEFQGGQNTTAKKFKQDINNLPRLDEIIRSCKDEQHLSLEDVNKIAEWIEKKSTTLKREITKIKDDIIGNKKAEWICNIGETDSNYFILSKFSEKKNETKYTVTVVEILVNNDVAKNAANKVNKKDNVVIQNMVSYDMDKFYLPLVSVISLHKLCRKDKLEEIFLKIKETCTSHGSLSPSSVLLDKKYSIKFVNNANNFENDSKSSDSKQNDEDVKKIAKYYINIIKKLEIKNNKEIDDAMEKYNLDTYFDKKGNLSEKNKDSKLKQNSVLNYIRYIIEKKKEELASTNDTTVSTLDESGEIEKNSEKNADKNAKYRIIYFLFREKFDEKWIKYSLEYKKKYDKEILEYSNTISLLINKKINFSDVINKFKKKLSNESHENAESIFKYIIDEQSQSKSNNKETIEYPECQYAGISAKKNSYKLGLADIYFKLFSNSDQHLVQAAAKSPFISYEITDDDIKELPPIYKEVLLHKFSTFSREDILNKIKRNWKVKVDRNLTFKIDKSTEKLNKILDNIERNLAGDDKTKHLEQIRYLNLNNEYKKNKNQIRKRLAKYFEEKEKYRRDIKHRNLSHSPTRNNLLIGGNNHVEVIMDLLDGEFN